MKRLCSCMWFHFWPDQDTSNFRELFRHLIFKLTHHLIILWINTKPKRRSVWRREDSAAHGYIYDLIYCFFLRFLRRPQTLQQTAKWAAITRMIQTPKHANVKKQMQQKNPGNKRMLEPQTRCKHRKREQGGIKKGSLYCISLPKTQSFTIL